MSAPLRGRHQGQAHQGEMQLVMVDVAGQPWGIPIDRVRDVLDPQRITPIPLAPPAVVGALNLRGHIVTVLDMRLPLGLGPAPDPHACANVVVEHEGEPYSLLVDAVGEAPSFPSSALEAEPHTMDPAWQAVADGVVRVQGRLLLRLDIGRFLAAASGA